MAALVALFYLVAAMAALRLGAAQPTTSPAEPPVTKEQETWTWCVTSSAEKTFCDSMTRILGAVDTEKDHLHNCVLGDGEDGCVKMIAAGQAKFVVLDGAEIYEANEESGLIPIRVEVSQSQGTYYGVAVVKKGQCPKNLGDLKGKRSCHTGYGRAAGWILPINKLISKKIIPVASSGPAQPDVQSVKNFFSKTCAANEHPETSICTACKTTTGCTESDLYYSYAGAFRGLVEGSCDVAFTKHTIPALYSAGGERSDPSWTNLADLTNYQILCPEQVNGQWCTDPNNYKACNWGAAPGHAIMTDPKWPAVEIAEFNEVLDTANNNPQFIDLVYSGKNKAGLIFSPDTVRLDAWTKDTAALLGDLYADIRSLNQVNIARVTTGPNAAPKAASVTSALTLAAAGITIAMCML